MSIMPENPHTTPVTSSTPEVSGMQEALATLQPDQMPKVSIFDVALNTVKASIIGGMPFNPFTLPALAMDVFTNMTVLPEAPLALVTAVPLVEKMRIQKALDDMSVVPEGKALVDMVRDTKAEIRIDAAPNAKGGVHRVRNMMNSAGDFRQEGGPIVISGYSSHGKLTGIMIHELQHRRQMHAGVLSPLNEKIPSPIEMIWHTRTIEADAEATAIDISYKMKEAGRPAAWNAIVGGDFAPHAALAYEAMAKSDPASIADGRAKREAFDKWFETDPASGRDVSKVYNHQGLSLWGGTAQMVYMASTGKPMAPLETADIKKVGAVSETNYLDLPNAKPLDSPFYRNPHWSPWQAARLATYQRQYESAKAGTSPPESKFGNQMTSPPKNGGGWTVSKFEAKVMPVKMDVAVVKATSPVNRPATLKM